MSVHRCARETAERDRHAKPCRRQVSPDARSGNAARGAAAGEEVRHRRSIAARDARIVVDDKSSLRMEQRAGHFGGKIRSGAAYLLFPGEIAPYLVLRLTVCI